MENTKHLKRFYGRRHGKGLSDIKQDLMDQMMPKLALPLADISDMHSLFGMNVDRIHLDIGFGGGENLIQRIIDHSVTGFIGAEPFIDGVGSFLAHLDNQADKSYQERIRLFADDVRDMIPHFPDASIDSLSILYPDPWPKARHHKRRMIVMDNLDMFARILKSGSLIELASDIPDYIENALENFTAHDAFEIISVSREPFEGWTSTRYEQKAIREGRTPQYVTLKRI